MKTFIGTSALLLWSGSALAVNTLLIGGSGNLATQNAYSVGDLSGSYTNITHDEYNAMSLSDLMAYDVVVLAWNTPSEFVLDWAGKAGPFVNAGGGFWWDGDSNNLDDLSPIVSATAEGCSAPWTLSTVPGLTDGITNEFVNCHVVYGGARADWLNPMGTDGAGQTNQLYGEYGGGRVYLTGPDHDFHASKGSGGDAGNQYNFVINIVNWLAEGAACEEVAWYEDMDADGYGNPAVSMMACEAPTDYVADIAWSPNNSTGT